MPLPIVFIGIAAATAAIGAASGTKGGIDQSRAKKLNDNSMERISAVAERLETLRLQCGQSLEELGKEKLHILDGNMNHFVELFSQLKNVDFTDSIGLEELKHLHIDSKEFEEIKQGNLSTSLVAGTLSGLTSGALSACGAYGAATMFASASTGTAISTLSGAAASNATLAFFGGGSLASGGLGVAGGTAILGGLVAGPAIMVMGIVVGAKGGTELEKAFANAAEADVVCEQLEAACFQCEAIRRRTYMFYSLLARLDSYFLPLISRLENIIYTEGIDYSKYSDESKHVVASTTSIAITVKAVLDTPILTVDGELTQESEEMATTAENVTEELHN